MSSEKTIVGVPFYEKEGQECLDITLKNIDNCLSKLAIDASIIVQVNGPDTAERARTDLSVNESQFNAEIEIVASDRVGQALAMDDIIETAKNRTIDRIFLTDADIYRFPDSMRNMWLTEDKAVVGARYRPYPLEIVEAHFGELSYEERLLYRIFDGDQIPEVRSAMNANGVDKKDWIKASLMSLDVNHVDGMHDGQNHATDSVMNRKLDDQSMSIANDALFMHMGRVDMTDHIKARLRHFRAANARGELDTFLHKEVRLPDEAVMNRVAQDIKDNEQNGDFLAMLYLCRCAVRDKVNGICMSIALGLGGPSELGELEPISMREVNTYADACRAISRFFMNIDWAEVEGFAVGPPPVTQEKLRQPFDMGLYMSNGKLARIAFESFGLTHSDEFLGLN